MRFGIEWDRALPDVSSSCLKFGLGKAKISQLLCNIKLGRDEKSKFMFAEVSEGARS
jgi:hypothetical protein